MPLREKAISRRPVRHPRQVGRVAVAVAAGLIVLGSFMGWIPRHDSQLEQQQESVR